MSNFFPGQAMGRTAPKKPGSGALREPIFHAKRANTLAEKDMDSDETPLGRDNDLARNAIDEARPLYAFALEDLQDLANSDRRGHRVAKDYLDYLVLTELRALDLTPAARHFLDQHFARLSRPAARRRIATMIAAQDAIGLMLGGTPCSAEGNGVLLQIAERRGLPPTSIYDDIQVFLSLASLSPKQLHNRRTVLQRVVEAIAEFEQRMAFE